MDKTARVSGRQRLCPFTGGENGCCGTQCAIYDDYVGECALKLLPYRLVQIKNAIYRLAGEEDEDEWYVEST